MKAGLSRLGTDFGNGAADGRFFQVDDQYQHYMRVIRAPSKSGLPRYRRHNWLLRDDGDRQIHDTVCAWVRDTFRAEDIPHAESDPNTGSAPPQGNDNDNDSDNDIQSPYDGLFRQVQEDALVVRADDKSGNDEVIMYHVALPGGWRPERILGASFFTIHRPVPKLADTTPQARAMVRTMVERGPYVRFVWTVCADDNLDHHPDEGDIQPWRAPEGQGAGWLRVERQVTVPFPAVGAALFLVRIYVYPLASLTAEQLTTLRSAIVSMPADVGAYKHLVAPRDHIVAHLDLVAGDRANAAQ